MYNPGWKYNHWEQKGVPIRIEVGPMDIEKNQVRAVIRHNGDKIDLPLEGLGAVIKDKLDDIHKAMFEKASAVRDEHVVQVTDWKDFVPNLEKNNLCKKSPQAGLHDYAVSYSRIVELKKAMQNGLLKSFAQARLLRFLKY